MNNKNKKILIFVGFFLLCLTAFETYAQENEIIAKRYFEEEHYDKAYKYYKNLLDAYPSNADYQYYTGVCLVKMAQQYTFAEELLTMASIKLVPVDVYFFLGKAQHFQYKFDDALISYKKFKQFGKFRDLKLNNPNKSIEEAELGLKLSKEIADIKVTEKPIAINEIKNHPALKVKSFALPIEIQNALYLTEKDNVLVYGDFPSPGGYLYVSGYVNKSGVGNKNIYKVKYQGGDIWDAPEDVGSEINSYGDEAYPYFDMHENALYFCSNGHKGIGGYDVYRSEYNSFSQKWSKVENLGLPINSPMNEFLYFPSVRNDISFLVTDRKGSKQMYLYELIHKIPFPRKNISNQQQLSDAMALNKNLEIVVLKTPSKNAGAIEKQYVDLLKAAMRLQLRADSFLRSSDDAQINATTRAKFKNEALVFQQKADEKYKLARELEKQLTDGKKTTKLTEQNFAQALGADKNTLQLPLDAFNMENKPGYKSITEIPTNIPLPHGLIYRIQLGVYSDDPGISAFFGIYPLSAETIKDKNLMKYYCGWFTNYLSAEKATLQIKTKGFPDAYIISYFDGQKISVNRARDLEK